MPVIYKFIKITGNFFILKTNWDTRIGLYYNINYKDCKKINSPHFLIPP